MTDHLSIRNIVKAGIGVNHVTVWRWRHRFLTAASKDNTAILSGVIEADETFFLRSFKGHRGWTDGNPPEDRAARPRAATSMSQPCDREARFERDQKTGQRHFFG
jgi:hypothetical protein